MSANVGDTAPRLGARQPPRRPRPPVSLPRAASLGGIGYDMLTDFPPRNGVAGAYGVAHEDGFSKRAVFVVDKRGTIVFRREYDIPVLPDNAAVRQAVERLP